MRQIGVENPEKELGTLTGLAQASAAARCTLS